VLAKAALTYPAAIACRNRGRRNADPGKRARFPAEKFYPHAMPLEPQRPFGRRDHLACRLGSQSHFLAAQQAFYFNNSICFSIYVL